MFFRLCVIFGYQKNQIHEAFQEISLPCPYLAGPAAEQQGAADPEHLRGTRSSGGSPKTLHDRRWGTGCYHCYCHGAAQKKKTQAGETLMPSFSPEALQWVCQSQLSSRPAGEISLLAK